MTTDTTALTGENSPLRSFRQTQDIENFYRFVNENGLRREAKKILELMHGRIKKANKKTQRAAKKKSKKMQ
jgi:hypothetical protein